MIPLKLFSGGHVRPLARRQAVRWGLRLQLYDAGGGCAASQPVPGDGQADHFGLFGEPGLGWWISSNFFEFDCCTEGAGAISFSC